MYHPNTYVPEMGGLIINIKQAKCDRAIGQLESKYEATTKNP